MPENAEKRKGEQFILFGGFLWSVFPIIVVLSYSHLSGLISLAWSTVFAAIFFVFLITYRKTWHQLKNQEFWKYVFGVAFFNGVLFYGLYYLGLEHTTPGNASLIGQLEILTSFLFFNMFKKEHFSREHIIGALFMLLGAFIVLSHNFSKFNIGDFFILAAIFCGPLGNHYQQKARKIVSTENILFARYLVSIPFIFLFAYFMNKGTSLGFPSESFLFLLFNGFIIFGLSKIFWIEGIHRISVTKALALSSAGPLVTILLSWLILNQVPTIWQLASFVPLSIGLLFLTDNLKLKKS